MFLLVGDFYVISSPLGPAVVTLIIAYIVSDLFFEIFQSLVDTIFLCFIIDSEVNAKGQVRSYVKIAVRIPAKYY